MRRGILRRYVHRRATVDADAPPAIAKDTPAMPKAGAALFRPFRFELVFVRAIRVLPYAVRLVGNRGSRH